MKKIIAAVLMLTLTLCVFAGCHSDTQKIKLGTSDITITVDKSYQKGEITSEDTDEFQVAYYYSEEDLLDFDIYQWAKATDETLEDAIAEEAEEFDAAYATMSINVYNVGYYYAVEDYDGTDYNTVTYMIDEGDYFVELVFWLDGDDAQTKAENIMQTLR